MTEKEFHEKLDKIKEENVQQEYLAALKDEKNKLKKKKITATKIIVLYLFIMLTAIIDFSMAAMWHFQDLSYLGILITDLAAQILVFVIYSIKAYFGKKQECLMDLEKEKLSFDSNNYEEGPRP